MSIRYIIALLWALALACLAIAWTFSARAHEWYDASCCQGDNMTGDCQQIPDSAVKAVDGGYLITLLPGEHRKVTVRHVWTREMIDVRPSKDDHYHACLWPDEATLRCFYAPPMGF